MFFVPNKLIVSKATEIIALSNCYHKRNNLSKLTSNKSVGVVFCVNMLFVVN